MHLDIYLSIRITIYTYLNIILCFNLTLSVNFNIHGGGRRFKVEEEDSKWGEKIQSGGRRFKVDVVFINIIIFILIISGTIITIIRSYFGSVA